MVTEKSAEKVYRDCQKQIDTLMNSIQQKLESHSEKFNKNKRNWCFPGDLELVQQRLNDIDIGLS